MKKVIASIALVLVASLGVIGLSACSTPAICGTYKFVSITTPQTVEGMEEYIESIEEMYKNSTYVIQKGGKGYRKVSLMGQTVKENFKWTKKGDELTMKFSGGTISWKVEGKKITLNNGFVLVYAKK